MPGPPPQAVTLIVRLWWEPRPRSAEGEWRGEVKAVPSGRITYFRHLSGLPEAVQRLLERETGAEREPTEEP